MARHGNTYAKPDHFAKRAKDEGYAARSVYKLSEIDERVRVLRQGQRVIDLGCYPGSWSRYAAEKVGRAGRVVGIDLQAPTLAGAIFEAISVYDVTEAQLREWLGGDCDVLLSDMAPLTTGNTEADHYEQVALARRALELAAALVKPGGSFICKVFDGADAQDFQAEARRVFAKVKRMRPEAVRKESREFFLVCQERRPLS